MGKKEKRKELEEKVSYPVEEEFSKFLKKYQKLVPFIDVEAVKKILVLAFMLTFMWKLDFLRRLENGLKKEISI